MIINPVCTSILQVGFHICDGPIPQVRRRHRDVYTQVGTTLTYIR